MHEKGLAERAPFLCLSREPSRSGSFGRLSMMRRGLAISAVLAVFVPATAAAAKSPFGWRGIVEGAKGRIWLDPGCTTGARFVVELPRT